ncbi:MAG: PfkB family carbohydrate kinase [Sedimentisphaerales bacterium]|jgi:sugar/nucleoside kinase (ribokinase family)|nr:PfkB family carbohydrate kinase [Sedimentisphaerales bacterium]
MSLLVTGSIAIDSVKTPFAVRTESLGGSAVYFTMAASIFGPVRLVGVIGGDCPFDLKETFAGRSVDLRGLEQRPKSKTFRWAGSYMGQMDERTTDLLELNVLAEAPPPVPACFRDSQFVFLANTSPNLQQQLLWQLDGPGFVAADTMDCWIRKSKKDLLDLLRQIDCLIINQQEAILLAGKPNPILAAQEILKMGVRLVVVKRGQAGAIVVSADGWQFVMPAYPVQQVVDPTGAGDSFAGGMLGYLASVNRTDEQAMRLAIAYGTVAASFAIEGFSLDRLSNVTRQDLDQRLDHLRELTRF